MPHLAHCQIARRRDTYRWVACPYRRYGGPHGRRHSNDLLQLWLVRHERSRGLAGRDPPGAAGRRAGLRRALVGGAPFLRLLVLPGQHAAAVVPGAALHARRPGHRGDHPAMERPAARRREGIDARPAERRSRAAGDRPRLGAPRVRRLPRHDGRLARALRRGGGDDSGGAAHRLHRGSREVLSAAAHRDPAAARTQLRRPHLRGGLQRGLRSRPRRG